MTDFDLRGLSNWQFALMLAAVLAAFGLAATGIEWWIQRRENTRK